MDAAGRRTYSPFGMGAGAFARKLVAISGKKVKVELVTGTVHHGALTAIEDEDCIVIDVEPLLPKPQPSTIVIRLSSVVWFGETHPLLT